MGRFEVLLESMSPNGDVLAVVERDERACHFYLKGDDASGFGLKSCWVRNFRPAPEELDVAGMRAGLPPMLPRRNCAHPQGAPPLAAANLEVVWSEEGDAAALFEADEILAVIPTWSGEKGFSGYARDCIEESTICWPLGSPAENVQHERYRRAAECWRAWSNGGVWEAFRDRMCNVLEGLVGKNSNYYAIDGGAWPPKALLRVPTAEDVLLLTVGVSLRPMPRVEMHYEDPSPHRRIELAMCLSRSVPDAAIKRIASYISAQTTLPWANHTFLGDGHTFPPDIFGELSDGRLSFALLQDRPSGAPDLPVPPFRGDPITYLWMTPISAREQTFAEKNGSSALMKKLAQTGSDWRHAFTRSELRV
jgi:hypothetical protein